jgi:hypothetical protein
MNGDGARVTGGAIVNKRGEEKATQVEASKRDRGEEEVNEY